MTLYGARLKTLDHAWVVSVVGPVAHAAQAWRVVKENNGGLYAGAITYFSFLALFPLILLAVAITGFVLHAHPAAQASLFDHISENVPGDFGKTLRSSIQTAIDARAGVGIVGLVGVLITRESGWKVFSGSGPSKTSVSPIA